jgi:dihydrofolate reductase
VHEGDPIPPYRRAPRTTAQRPGPALLARAGRTHVYVDGGQAVRQGLREGLLTSLTLTVIPTMLGAGRPLFDETVPESNWRPTASIMYPTGPVQLQYARVGD